MRLYKLTKVGKAAYQSGAGSAEEKKIIDFLHGQGSATETELELAGENWKIRSMKRHGLIKEITEERGNV